MKVFVYSMRDQLTGFTQPTFEISDAVAIRNFSFAIQKPDTLIYASAKDFDLMKIGEFDSETGVLTPLSPTLVCQGISILKGKNELQK